MTLAPGGLSEENHGVGGELVARERRGDERPFKPEAVDHPAHYNVGGIEVADIADAYDLGRYEFNVVKYVLRAKFKGAELEDLKKAVWYLKRCIDLLEKADGSPA